MYFRESVTIASNQIGLADTIRDLDEFLFLNQETPVSLSRVISVLDVDDDMAATLVELYVEAGVLTPLAYSVCPTDGSLLPLSDNLIECDLCEKQYACESIDVETCYTPRLTVFECGDQLKTVGSATSASVDGIFPIIGCSNEDRAADVIFLHGLDGDATTTWHPKAEPSDYWPKWLGEDLPNVGIWSVDYEASSLNWHGTALPLEDRATNVIEKLLAAGLGDRPIIFICHSLGGLLAKQILRHAKEMANEEWSPFAQNTRLIIFLATPHSGSSVSGYVQYMKAVLLPTVAVTDLTAHDPHLRGLNVWYRNNVQMMNVQSRVFYETRKTKSILVVDPTSSDPGIAGVIPVPIDADHVEICKPVSRSDVVYARCKKLVSQAVGS